MVNNMFDKQKIELYKTMLIGRFAHEVGGKNISVVYLKDNSKSQNLNVFLVKSDKGAKIYKFRD